MAIKVKFCGLKSIGDIKVANALRIDFVGFVFVPQSKRFITYETARLLKQNLDSTIQAVGVFVNEDVEVVADLLNQGIIDIAQLHGDESDRYIQELRSKSHKIICKAFKVQDIRSIDLVNKSIADFVLLDSSGGSGKAFDWGLLPYINRPYFLAGGINIANIQTAILHNPFALDLSSGIESSPGIKDEAKMREIMQSIKTIRSDDE